MAGADDKPDFLVDARFLSKHRDDPNVVLVDTRPASNFWSGHLAGARHFNPFAFHHVDTSDSGLREFQAQLEWIFSALGISGEQTVVFYEDDSGMRATRAAWSLEYMGHPGARVLDGGLGRLAGASLVTTVSPVAPTRFVGAPQEELIASFEYVAAHLNRSEAQIFDVRTDEEYYGEWVRARRGGAIPGALHLDWVNNVGAEGAFEAAAQLRAAFERVGLRPDAEVITYCQGGYRSANAYFALKLAGFPHVRNYLGSWGEWGNREELPIGHPKRPARSRP